jgi:hypothetical protein
MQKLIIDNFRRGMVPYWYKATNLARFGEDNQYARGVVDPFSNPSVIQPANNTFNDLVGINQLTSSTAATKFVFADDYPGVYSGGRVYMAQANKLHQINPNNQTISSTAPFPYVINPAGGTHAAHTDETVDDIMLYQLNGVPGIWTFYRDSVDGDGTFYNLNATFSTNDSGFSSATGGTVLNKKYPIICEPADNGFAYIANGNAIHRLDGTLTGGAAGTVVQTVIDIGSEWVIKDIKDWRGKLLILAEEAEDNWSTNRRIRMYLWNRVSSASELTFSDIINIQGVTGEISRIFFHDNIPCMIVGVGEDANETTYQLRAFDGARFVKIINLFGSNFSTLDLSAFKVPAVSFRNGLLFVPRDADIIYLDDPFGTPSIFQTGLLGIAPTNKIIGGLFQVSQGASVYIHYNTTSSGGSNAITEWQLNPSAGIAFGSFYTKVYDLPKLSNIKELTVYYEPLTSTQDKNLSITFLKNMSQSSNGVTCNVNYLNDGKRGYTYFPLGGEKFEAVNQIQLLVSWDSGETIANSPKISRIEIGYEQTTRVR